MRTSLLVILCLGAPSFSWADPAQLIPQHGHFVATQLSDFQKTEEAAMACLKAPSTQKALGARSSQVMKFYKSQDALADRKDGQIVLGTTPTQKAYLSFSKLLRSCRSAQYEKIGPVPVTNGVHDENSPLLGTKAALFKVFKAFALQHAEVIRFGHALYYGNASCPSESMAMNLPSARAVMLPAADAEKVRALAKPLLNAKLKQMTLTYAQAVQSETDQPGAGTMIQDLPGQDWSDSVLISPDGYSPDEGHSLVPAELLALHEWGHIERTLPGEAAHYYDILDDPQGRLGSAIEEIGPALGDVVMYDKIYKTIHGIDLTKDTHYPANLPSDKGTLNTGTLALVISPLLDKYGTVEAALMSPEGLAFLNKYYLNSCTK